MLAAIAPFCGGFSDLQFLAVGDWGGLPFPPWTTPAQHRVAASMGEVAERHEAKFVLSLGDHFYFHGVKSADDPRWRRSFERVYDHAALQGAGFWRAVAGNHDHDGNVSAQLAYAARPASRWYFPSLQYRFREELPDATTVDFVMLDTSLLCPSRRRRLKRRRTARASVEQHWAWVQEALDASADASYLVVAGHFPVHSPSGHGPTPCLRERLDPMIRRSRASIYLSGHDHALFHVGKRSAAAGGGVQYHGVGAGFALSRSTRHAHTVPVGQLRFHRRARSLLRGLAQGGFAGVSVSAAGMTVTHYDEAGAVAHQHTVRPRETTMNCSAAAGTSADR